MQESSYCWAQLKSVAATTRPAQTALGGVRYAGAGSLANTPIKLETGCGRLAHSVDRPINSVLPSGVAPLMTSRHCARPRAWRGGGCRRRRGRRNAWRKRSRLLQRACSSDRASLWPLGAAERQGGSRYPSPTSLIHRAPPEIDHAWYCATRGTRHMLTARQRSRRNTAADAPSCLLAEKRWGVCAFWHVFSIANSSWPLEGRL